MEIKEANITPNTKIDSPQKTFFFERHDGSIIFVEEREAHTLLKGGNKVVGPRVSPPKLIGVSDGTKFQEALGEAHQLMAEGKKEEAILRLKKGEQEELEAARGHIERPRNFDMRDTNSNPVDLSQLR